MADLFPTTQRPGVQKEITIVAQIQCVRREIGMRERVYPAWVRKGSMKQDQADYEMEVMRAVLRTLQDLEHAGIVSST